MNAPSKDNFLTMLAFGSITRQNGVVSGELPPFIVSKAASATILKNIPVVSGQVQSALLLLAKSTRICWTLTL